MEGITAFLWLASATTLGAKPEVLAAMSGWECRLDAVVKRLRNRSATNANASPT